MSTPATTAWLRIEGDFAIVCGACADRAEAERRARDVGLNIRLELCPECSARFVQAFDAPLGTFSADDTFDAGMVLQRDFASDHATGAAHSLVAPKVQGIGPSNNPALTAASTPKGPAARIEDYIELGSLAAVCGLAPAELQARVVSGRDRRRSDVRLFGNYEVCLRKATVIPALVADFSMSGNPADRIAAARLMRWVAVNTTSSEPDTCAPASTNSTSRRAGGYWYQRED